MIIKKNLEDFYVKEVIDFPNSSGNYSYYLLWKKNLTTIRAIKIIKKKLRISRYRISYAGKKDKRAITEQYISIKDFEGKEKYDFGNVKLYYIGNFSEPVSIKLLKGNIFRILVRDINKLERKEFYKVLKIAKKAFPNYFDEQRFGDIRCINHLVGICLLKRDYENACKIILTYVSDRENERARRSREFLNKNWGKFSEALKIFPKYLDIETPILNHLVKKPKDFKGALKTLHKKLLKMFIHSVQSYIFNLTLSKIIETEFSKTKCISFSFGKLHFPYEIPKKNIKIPIVGYDTNLDKFYFKNIILELLEKLNIRLEDFYFEDFPLLKSKGSERDAFVKPEDLKFEEKDGNIELSFFLPKGSYATILVKYLFIK